VGRIALGHVWHIEPAPSYQCMCIGGHYSDAEAEWFITSEMADTTTFDMSTYSWKANIIESRSEAP
jgi:hypothetical protein